MSIKNNDFFENRISELEHALQASEKGNLALDAAGFDVWETNFVTGESVGSNVNMLRSMGYDDDDMPDRVEDIMTIMHPSDRAPTMEAIQNHFAGKTERYRAEFRIQAKDGTWIWMGNYGQVKKRNEKGEVTCFIGVTFNIDQRRITEEMLKTLAYTDDLTKLGNRRMLFQDGDLELEKATRYNHPLSMFMTDIDGFKQINDEYGHIVGDTILKEYAICMNDTFRNVDMKLRYGGDEFIIIMPETDIEEATKSANRFLKNVSAIDSEIQNYITTSIGVAEFKDKESLESLIKRADLALYDSKALGGNTLTVAKS